MKNFREWDLRLDKRVEVSLLDLTNGAQNDFKFVLYENTSHKKLTQVRTKYNNN
jgi:hypothetical protein